jgi:DNA polymerase
MSNDHADILNEVAAQVRACTLCPLHRGRTRAVPGAGNPNAEIMFIGEGPGFHEDQQGLPFVGRSGDYLVRLLKMIGMTRDQVFIANVIKCRPPDNRDPLPDEMQACKPYLDRQVEVIDPLVIATLGRFSMARHFPGGKISQIHGKPKYEDGRAYYPLYHPAAVLRSPSLEPQMEADFKRLIDVLAKVREMRAAGAKPVDKPKDDPPLTQLTLF